MPSDERDVSRGRSASPKHLHSFSETGKVSVPMWDSSDPDRAPPPLPLNPTTSSHTSTRPNGANVAAAAQALVERARENAGPSQYVTNMMQIRENSPEKSPSKTPQHRRLQSLQNPNLKDFKASLENVRPLDWTSSHPSTPSSTRDFFTTSPERSPSRAETPTPGTKDGMHRTPSIRPSSRPGPRPILGENTPPSATMLAIQNMPRKDLDSPLGDITNASTPTPTVRSIQNVDGLSTQMQHLTSIANTLQKEMAALSRRSKDNATDLVSLKEATKSRDEDIRKSLRELVTNARTSDFGLFGSPRGDNSRAASALDFSPRYLDISSHHASPPFVKSVSLPKIPTIDEQDRASSPSPYSVQGASTMSMLEKIIREMVTKEGQERLLSSLSELLEKSSKESKETAKKVEELVDFIREKSTSKALVKHEGSRRFSFEDESIHDEPQRPKYASTPIPAPAPQTINIVSEELKSYLQKLKDSIAQGGGLTGEVKSLVRELRGEVLGMGRELGKRIDVISQSRGNDRALIVSESSKDDLSRVVQEGLSDLKEQMEQVILAKRRQSSGSALSRRSIDSSDVYALVKQSLEEQGMKSSTAVTSQAQELDYDKMVAAVNDAFDAHPFEPEVKVEYLGLDRDEILQCLKEGMEEYHSSRAVNDLTPASKEEIFDIVKEALQTFSPPAPSTDVSDLKEELSLAVKGCLEDFKMQSATQGLPRKPGDITKDDILEAVRTGLGTFKKEGAREIDINREDLFDAVSSGLDNLGYGDEVLEKLQQIVERVRIEFKEYSAANGRDTELVLDSTKDGLENLRERIEEYVDRAKDVTGKDEIISSMKLGLDNLYRSIEQFAAGSARNDSVAQRAELVDYIKTEFQNLHEIIAEQNRSLDSNSITKEQIIMAMTAGIAELKSGLGDRDADEQTEEMLEAMKDEFDNLRQAILDGTAAHKDELLDSIRDNLGSLQSRGLDGDADSNSASNIIIAMKEEFETLRSLFSAPVLHSGQSSNGDILETIQQQLENIRVQLSEHQSEAKEETFGAIRGEVERLRETMSSAMVHSTSLDDRVVILETIREGLEELKTSGPRSVEVDTNEALHTVLQELKQFKDSIKSTIVSGGSQADPDIIIGALQSGFDDVRTQIDRIQHNNSQPSVSEASEIVETLNAGIESLRADIGRLKQRGGDVVLADGEEGTRDFAPSTQTSSALNRKDLEILEVALTRLHIKVEAMDQNIQAAQPMPQEPIEKEALTTITNMIGELQNSVATLVINHTRSIDGGVMKEDTDAIETLLLNTKAKIDDTLLPALVKMEETGITRDHLDAVEAVVRLTNEAVDGLTNKIGDNVANKDDVAAVYALLEQVSGSVKALQEQSQAAKDDMGTKIAIEELGELCRGIESTVDDLPTSDDLPSKEDFEALNILVKDFKTIHEGFKQQYETDLMITAQAFDDRKSEATKILEQIEGLKGIIEASKDELKSRMRRGNEDVRALDEILQGIEEKIDTGNAAEGVQEVLQIINREFENAQASVKDLQSGHAEQFEALAFKHDQVKASIIEELAKKLDACFSEVLGRHDEQQRAVEQAAEAMARKAVQQDRLLLDSGAIAEELKLTIDTLGISITEISPALKEATEKMSDDAKTVFNKVSDVHSRLDANHVDIMTEHELTRQDIANTLSAAGTLRDEFSTFQPQALETLSSLLAIAGEHYEHSKQFANTAQPQAYNANIEETINRGFAALPRLEAPSPAQPSYDDSDVQLKLDKIIAFGKYDDAGKLDKILNHAAESNKHAARLAKLDDIHQQVLDTAAEVAAFVAHQKQLLTASHDDKIEEARQVELDLERYKGEKEDLELKIDNLTQTRSSLAADVGSLMAERDALASQKSRLGAELSSIETALKIRREELETMDSRADALERRIIERVMDHSRALLLTKQARAPVNMSLKRVTSNVSNATTTPSVAASNAMNAMNMALKNTTGVKKPSTISHHTARRILSLNQITGNTPGGTSGAVSPLPRIVATGLNSLKRSQSTRTPALRKASWAGQGSLASYDKENGGVSEEEEELDDDVDMADCHSGSATSMSHRSGSYAETMASGTDRRTSYGTGPSEYSYMSGSYMTGTESDRRTSYGSTIRSTVAGTIYDSIDGEDEEDDEGSVRHKEVAHDTVLQLHEGDCDHQRDMEEEEAMDTIADLSKPHANNDNPSKRPVIRIPDGYDSGLGSDLPTADMSSAGGSDYFRAASES